MRGWLVALPLAFAACASLSGLDELGVCDGSACADATSTTDSNVVDVVPDTPLPNEAGSDVASKDGGGGDSPTAPPPLTVPCGQNNVCVLDGGTACCVVEAGAPFCWDPPDCVGFTLLCTGKAQCEGGVCCATNVDTTPGIAECTTSCGASHPAQLCNPNDVSPCPVGKSCLKITNGVLANVFYACQ